MNRKELFRVQVLEYTCSPPRSEFARFHDKFVHAIQCHCRRAGPVSFSVSGEEGRGLFPEYVQYNC